MNVQLELDPVAKTCRWSAGCRYRESQRSDRLFEDPFAEHLAGPEGLAYTDKMEETGPFVLLTAVRTRFIDEIVDAAARTGTRQAVILAAGMDARAYRLSWPQGTTVFEIDRPEVVELKDRLLREMGAVPRCATRIAFAADLTSDWQEALRARGFDPAVPTVWICEGATAYMTPEGTNKMLDQVSALSAPGSRAAITFAASQQQVGDIEGGFREIGAPWRHMPLDANGLMRERGWEPRSTTPAVAAVSYGRSAEDFSSEIGVFVAATRSARLSSS